MGPIILKCYSVLLDLLQHTDRHLVSAEHVCTSSSCSVYLAVLVYYLLVVRRCMCILPRYISLRHAVYPRVY